MACGSRVQVTTASAAASVPGEVLFTNLQNLSGIYAGNEHPEN